MISKFWKGNSISLGSRHNEVLISVGSSAGIDVKCIYYTKGSKDFQNKFLTAETLLRIGTLT